MELTYVAMVLCFAVPAAIGFGFGYLLGRLER